MVLLLWVIFLNDISVHATKFSRLDLFPAAAEVGNLDWDKATEVHGERPSQALSSVPCLGTCSGAPWGSHGGEREGFPPFLLAMVPGSCSTECASLCWAGPGWQQGMWRAFSWLPYFSAIRTGPQLRASSGLWLRKGQALCLVTSRGPSAQPE